MLSIGVVRSSMAAASYFAKDNYYTQHEEGPSHWFGAGAEKLGLTGEVEAGRFKELLEGRIDADTLLGRGKGDNREHLHGWDLTFSAPKSVSLATLVGGDERLVAAHDAAVKEVLRWLQENALTTRLREQGEITEQHTGAMVAAVFRHDLSRAAEAQLHSHAVVMNATINDKDQWQSIHSIRLYFNSKEGTERYQQALAWRVAELGYGIVPSHNGTFELAGMPRELCQLHSSRSQAIETRLAAQGLTRATATGRQREQATLLTRGAKPEIDRVQQRSQDRAQARALGFDLERFVAQAKERSREQEITPNRRLEQAVGREQTAADRTRAAEQERPQTNETALRAVREAAAILTERDAAFTDKNLQQRARLMSLGLADARQIEQAVAQLQSRGELVERQVRAIDPVTKHQTLMPGFTTAAMIEAERRMLALEQAGRGAVDRFMHRLDAQALVGQARALAEDRGFGWTHGQAEATKGVLTTSARVIGIQGVAGSAKTTTVLATVAEAARDLGYTVKGIKGMAPTTSATLELAQAIGGEAVTVQRQVAELERGTEGRGSGSTAGKQLWIVDEASMVGTHAMHTLLAGATLQDARVLLVGDTMQLGSVEAGRAFAQLQEAGMPTFRLPEIVRQTNPDTKEAVYASLQADAGRALQAIERGGGEVVEIKGKSHEEDAHDRRAFLAERYAALSPAERARTLLADPSRAGSKELNEQVREAMRAQGELSGPALALDILVPKGLTTGEQKQPVFYARGDIVAFRRDLAPHQQDRLEKGVYYTVAGTDQHGGRIQLQKADGSFVIWRPGSHGARDAEIYGREQRELAAGDRITWTKALPDIGIANGQKATVAAVDPARGSFTIEQNGKRITLDAGSTEARHLEHAYAQTAMKLQGKTAERALIHAEHWRLNLINQRSFYVLISRAKDGVVLATSDRAGLVEAIRERSGEQQAALDRLEARQAPEIARAAMQEVTQERERERQQQHEQQQQRERALQQQRERTDDDTRKPKPGGRDADLGQERDGPSTSRQQDRDYDDDMGY
ncbi:MAG: MobF family relaxase [Geminicoccaceae bacterium]